MATASPSSPKPAPGRGRLWVLLGVLAVVGVFWFIGRQQSKPTPEMIAQANAGWLTSYEEAVAQSQRTGKPILVDFTADWCMPCQYLKFEVFPTVAVQAALHERYIPLRADVTAPDTPGPGPELSLRYRIEATPTLLVIDAAGRPMARQVGAMPPDQLAAWLQTNAPAPGSIPGSTPGIIPGSPSSGSAPPAARPPAQASQAI